MWSWSKCHPQGICCLRRLRRTFQLSSSCFLSLNQEIIPFTYFCHMISFWKNLIECLNKNKYITNPGLPIFAFSFSPWVNTLRLVRHESPDSPWPSPSTNNLCWLIWYFTSELVNLPKRRWIPFLYFPQMILHV